MACNEERKAGQGVGREGWEMVREGFRRDGTLEQTLSAVEGLGDVERRKQNVGEAPRWE